MYLFLGTDKLIKSGDVIGVFDMDTTTVSKLSRDYLHDAEQSGRVEYVSYELPKSFVVCSKNRCVRNKSAEGKNTAPDTVYISQISSQTLLKRADFIRNLGKAAEKS